METSLKTEKARFPQQFFRILLHTADPVSQRAIKSRMPACVPMSTMPASVSLSTMLKLGKIIAPSKEMVTIYLEEFSVDKRSWLDPFETRLSISKEKFASGGFRDAFQVTALYGLKGKYVLKKCRPDQVSNIEELFGSLEIHTRKAVQMHCLARNFAEA